MDFPDRDVALAWAGRTLIDRDGAEIGACTGVFSDDATRLTEWIRSELGGTPVLIPAVGATESGGQVQVAVSRADVASAPSVGGAQHISEEEEATLYRHYGIPHSRDASPTLLPTEEPPTEESPTEESRPPAEGVASDAAAPEVVETSTAAEPVAEPVVVEPVPVSVVAKPVAVPAAPEPVAEPVVAEDAVSPPESAPDVWQGPSEKSAPSAGRNRRVAPVVGGLAGLGLAVGVALRARRLWTRRRPTRTERLAERGRAASVSLTARTGQIAASAAPVLENTKQVVRRRRGAGAVAGGVPAAALALAAVRRRRSRDQPHD